MKNKSGNNIISMIEHYNSLYDESIKKITANEYEIDNLIDSPSDNRFGITLLIRPKDYINDNIQKFLDELKSVEPEQYYYPNSDIHVTVMSIISCYNGFELENISIDKYIDLINKSLTKRENINIEFNGITASPSCVMIQGFLSDNTLNDIRDNLRTIFINSGLEQSIDQRYTIQAAHLTVARFRKPLTRKKEFLGILDKYRNYYFGNFSADTMELVYNDWYQRKKFVRILHLFKLS